MSKYLVVDQWQESVRCVIIHDGHFHLTLSSLVPLIKWLPESFCGELSGRVQGTVLNTAYFSDLQVPFETASDAEVALKSLTVDPEPPRSGVTKVLRIENNSLCVYVYTQGMIDYRAPVYHFFVLLLLRPTCLGRLLLRKRRCFVLVSGHSLIFLSW